MKIKVKLDNYGRITIPSHVRQALNMTGKTVEIEFLDDRLEIPVQKEDKQKYVNRKR